MPVDLAAIAALAAVMLSAGAFLVRRIDRRFDDLKADLRDRFNGIDQRFDGIDRRLDGIDQRFDGIDRRLDGIDQRFDGIDRRLDGIDQRFDGIDRRLDGIDQRFDGIDRRLDGIDRRLDGIDQRLDGVDRRLDAQTVELGNLRQDVGRLQGVVERTYEQHRFPGATATARESAATYDARSDAEPGQE